MNELSELLGDEKEIDIKKTIENVKYFFKVKYDKLLMLASEDQLQGIRYDKLKVSSSPINNIESTQLKRIKAQGYLNNINQCINSLDPLKAKVLRYRLIDNKMMIEVESIIGYSHKSTYRIFNNACYEFAQRLKLLADIDLLEYKE
ncbi:ArpU family phage packaging/lysis transcriptional regulator [Ligilactobacillus salivarius]|uniref:ArpU family phage packaging/lysis transcriptional regulator n=1 Tax=Ligilactobacillus salivarius TaxID=1624 RepID=UPI0009DB52A4|nr:ArpU family phage packaging/lysis transcriptional regulator [Ligilactobacillus salivarius]ATP35088.1 hypothetical protein CR249_02060 [Ligilactobacillus salivarius]OQR04053.1 hypothetical protein B6U48_01655 [Ligilactobacillus salivarius]OQR05447.1 hypothetical protein B6U49_01600 [Ligilactobacillus salivarius]